MKSTSITPTLSQSTVTITFPADCWDLNFFERSEIRWRHSIDAFFDSGSKWWTQVSFPVTICCKKVFHYGNIIEVQNKLLGRIVYEPLWTALGPTLHTWIPQGIHDLCSTPCTYSARSLIVMHLFSLINASAWSMLAELWAEDGLPLLGLLQRSLSAGFSCRSLIRFTHLVTVL